MARYADIDVLLEHLATNDEGNFRTAITQWLEMHQVEDVAPVIHAHWIEGEDLNCNPVIRCSACKDVCHIESDSAFGDHFYFCPNCGAKMDEEVE